MTNYSKPSQTDLNDEASMAGYLNGQTSSNEGPLMTTNSKLDTPQYAASSYNVSEILQGVGTVNDPSDTMLVMAKGMNLNINKIYDANPEKGGALFSNASDDLSQQEEIYGKTGFLEDGKVDPGWAAALPTEIYYKAPGATESSMIKLWAKSGLASGGLHLPVASSLMDDIGKHLQLSTLKPDRQHPYYMDRDAQDGKNPLTSAAPFVANDGFVYNWESGEAILKNTAPDNSSNNRGTFDTTDRKGNNLIGSTTVGGEDPNKPGKPGAFGYLNPLSEQWYIAMPWPSDRNKGKWSEIGMFDIDKHITEKELKLNNYLGCKVLVVNQSNGKGVVLTPGDLWLEPSKLKYSTNTPDQCHIAALSPDAMEYLGIVTNLSTKISVGFVSDTWQLGPYVASETSPSYAQDGSGGHSDDYTGNADETGAPDGPGSVTPGWSGNGGSFASSKLVNTLDEIKQAYKKIRDHPNFWATKKDDQIPGKRIGYNEAVCRPTQMYSQFTFGHPITTRDTEPLIENNEKTRAFAVPALLNFLWVTLEAGWILDMCAGVAGGGGPGHQAGGAIDIQAFGHKDLHGGNSYAFAMEWAPWPGLIRETNYLEKNFRGPPTNNPKKMEIYNNYLSLLNQFVAYVKTLPKSFRLTSLGAPVDVDGDPKKGWVHQDWKPNHMHIEIMEWGKIKEQIKGSSSPNAKQTSWGPTTKLIGKLMPQLLQ